MHKKFHKVLGDSDENSFGDETLQRENTTQREARVALQVARVDTCRTRRRRFR